MLRELDSIPEGLLELEARQLERALGGPALIHLPGRQSPALFVTVLLHGNEPVGWDAVRGLLACYQPGGGERPLPRALSLFIGNVSAAVYGVRCLEGQPDYNRIWPGGAGEETPERRMLRQVVGIMAAREVFASVDLHNNTGLNPHYACVNVLDQRALHLATLFGRVVVYFRRPRGVQSMALSELCPAVTLECGKVGQPYGVEHAREFLEAALHLTEHPAHPVAEHDIELLHTVATVKVPEPVSFGFGEPGVDLQFAEDLDHLNFRELPRGTVLALLGTKAGLGLEIFDEQGNEVTARYLVREADELRLRNPLIPSMLTRDHAVIRQDCLCYLMERLSDLPGGIPTEPSSPAP
jgi:succinylglutamate desuccinylase